MTLITGTLRDSAGLLSGRLRVQLSAPLIDTSTTPDTTYLPIEQFFAVTNGAISINLPQTQTANLTYNFTFQTASQQTSFFFEDGSEYVGVTHVHTDTFTYTGSYHSVESIRLSPLAQTVYQPIYSFDAVVPNLASIEYSSLLPTSIATDRLPLAVRQVADLLAYDGSYKNVIGDILLPYKGDWSATVWYSPREWVTYDGGSWVSIWPQPHVGNVPTNGSNYWKNFAARGANGTGTTGNDAAYNAAGWDGQTDAPSRNAVRDIIELLPRSLDAVLTGNPTAPTQPQGTNNTRLANCAFVIAEFIARITNVTLPGVPTLSATPLLTDNSQAVVNSNFVKSTFHRYSRIIDSKASGTQGGAAIAGINTRDLNTITINSGDVVTLASNTFTLRAGTYRINAIAPAGKVDAHRAFLWNVTASTRVLNGTSAYSSAVDTTYTVSMINGSFTIAANTDFQIRHFTQTANNINGLGALTGEAGQPEIYTIAEIWRLD